MKRLILSVLLSMVLMLLLSSIVAGAESPPTFLTKWGSNGTGDGQFRFPWGIAVDGSGNVYVADFDNYRIQKFDASGTFLTKWGSVGNVDGKFYWPRGVAVDGAGNVYVADGNNNRIQKFDAGGTFLTKWGSGGSADGQFDLPSGIAVDGSGNVYVADFNNNRIQKFGANGSFLAKWGSYGAGNGQFNLPRGIAVDGAGNVYVVDSFNRRIQKFDASGNFLAKWGSSGNGDGQFVYPRGVAVDGTGNVYVADGGYISSYDGAVVGNHRIEKFNSDGTFLAKWGSYGSGDGQFYDPTGVAVDGTGKVYVTDCSNNRIQVFQPGSADTTAPSTSVSLSGTAGQNGWFTSNVTVTLTATDNDGSGVKTTEYSFDGNSWMAYSAPFGVNTEGTTTVHYRSTDNAGNVETPKTQAVKIDKTAPAVTVTTPRDYDVLPVGTALGFGATDGKSGLASVKGYLSDGTATTERDSGYQPEVGIYTLVVKASDMAGNLGQTAEIHFVIYDPEGGFVTGGGWLDSPAGAYRPDATLAGKATFGFLSKYKKGVDVPTGDTEFQFNTGSLDFYSSTYDWLVVNKAGTNAQFKGEGTINGKTHATGPYKFQIWATDGSPDSFRIKIWWEDAQGNETTVYDNGTERAISGGSILVHTGKN